MAESLELSAFFYNFASEMTTRREKNKPKKTAENTQVEVVTPVDNGQKTNQERKNLAIT